MNKPFTILITLVAVTLLGTACSAKTVEAAPELTWVESMIGRSMTDREVADFLTRNNCASLEQFRLCKDAGLTFEVSPDQEVKTVFIYLEDTEGFKAYRGDVPFGLKYYDTWEIVEHKLRKQRVGTGTPNEGHTPDHTHYWATYYSARMTIIYNSPSPEDRSASMHALVLK